MGSLYRSEDMVLCQMYLQSDTAYSCVAQLGELGIVQFKDLNANVNAFQRQFVSEIRRCEEMERQLRFFEREMSKQNIVPDHVSDSGPPVQRDMVDIEASFDSLEADLKDLTNSVESLEKNYLELEELLFVLEFTNPHFEHGEPSAPREVDVQDTFDPFGVVDLSAGSGTNLQYLSGVLPTERFNGFNRLLWFASHGNVLIRYNHLDFPVKDKHSQEMVKKTVFVVMFQGEQLMAKVRKISEGFKANIYPCPDKIDERKDMMENLRGRMTDLKVVLMRSQEQYERMLHFIARSFNAWAIKVRKLKAIYMVMNMFQNESQNFIAECWMPHNELGVAQGVLNRVSETAGNQVSSLLHPIPATVLPTYHKVNKFTRAYQAVIDAYGVASYKEVNPAGFSIITFPFLFSVMFGDAGHGVLLLSFALFLIIREQHLVQAAKNSEMFGMIFGGRYLMLLMGLFSIYSGLVYNDVFSKSVQIFGSGWSGTCMPEEPTTNGVHVSKDWQLDPSNSSCFLPNQPYVFGVDPIWQLSENKIMFTNSFKKKISVIFGVSQMLLGVILSICNHVYFRRYLNIVCEFLPQLLFLLSIFGYLCGLIFTKWVLPTTYLPPYIADDPKYNYYQCSPNILIGFINMFLLKYDSAKDTHCSNVSWFPGQQPIQVFLLLLAVISALWMLLSKPLILMFMHRKKNAPQRLVDYSGMESNQQADVDDVQLLSDVSATDVSDDQLWSQNNQLLTMPLPVEEEFDAGEVFIHQAIHTIEFCLGCISHTASYLRLWALSLAHAQLSEVLWTMVMRFPFTLAMPWYVNSFLIFCVFTPFAVMTVVILLIMEGLSAFLHTLRLHWVEFNSKFYKGEGVAFEPFSFTEILNKD